MRRRKASATPATGVVLPQDFLLRAAAMERRAVEEAQRQARDPAWVSPADALRAGDFVGPAGLGQDGISYVAPPDPARPRFEPLPCRAVYQAIKQHGWASAEHLAAHAIAEQARAAYCHGLDWPDPLYRPSPQMRVFLRKEFEIGIGGAKGGAKTFLLPMYMTWGNPWLSPTDAQGNIILHRSSYIYHPNFIGLILRRNLTDMQEIIAKARTLFEMFGGNWSEENKTYNFPSGAFVGFGHIADRESYQKYFGRNIIKLAIDELVQIPEYDTYELIRSCVRSVYPDMRAQVLVTFNPKGGPGVQWVYDYFIEPKQRHPDNKDALIPILGADGQPMNAFGPDDKPIFPEPTIKAKIDPGIFAHLGVAPPTDSGGKEMLSLDRVFIPAFVTDNPYLMDSTYVLNLASMGTEDRNAYLLGKWDLGGGAYFTNFRAERRPHEPENALHVVPGLGRSHPPGGRIAQAGELDISSPLHVPRPISFFWDRAIGGDWAFSPHEAAFVWGAENPTTRQYEIYRERTFHEIMPEVVGYEIALESAAELREHPRHSMILWIGEDAHQDRTGGGRAIIELLAAGIKRALGPNSVHMPDYVAKRMMDSAHNRALQRDSARAAEGSKWAQNWEQMPSAIDWLDPESIRQVILQRASGITIRQALNDRVIGWQLCRSFLRFAPIVPLGETDLQRFDASAALNLLFSTQTNGPQNFSQYMADFAKQQVEVLPRIQIWDNCVRLIAAIPKAKKSERQSEDVDKRHFNGMDVLDAWRYLIMGLHARRRAADEPAEVEVERRFEEAARAAERRGHPLDINGMIKMRAAITDEVGEGRAARGNSRPLVSPREGLAGAAGIDPITLQHQHRQRVASMLGGRSAIARIGSVPVDWRKG